jgi:CRP-like cAMP-binding protein
MTELVSVHLDAGQRLAFPEETIEHVYFPRDAVMSMLVSMGDGKTVESAAVGNEGILGLEVFLGSGIALEETLVQISGEAARMTAILFRSAVGRSAELQDVLQRFALGLMNQIARNAGCNRVHTVEERCARMLLMSRDQTGRDDFSLTHEFLAKMLGVRRASVSQAAENLQRADLIRYRQGRIHILDGDGLENAACEDYRLTRAVYDRLY